MTRLFRVFVLAAALLGLSAPTTASADFGSGTLGDWSKYSHGIVGDPATADVWVVGDSITARGYPALVSRLQAKGLKVAVNYWSSRPTAPAVDWVLAQPVKPKILLMTAGANDVYDPSVLTAQIKRLKAGLPTTTKLIWSDVQVSRTKYSQTVQIADQRNSMWINMQLREQLTPAQVCSWSGWFTSAPWRLTSYLQDGVHPIVGKGTDFWAAVMAACVTR